VRRPEPKPKTSLGERSHWAGESDDADDVCLRSTRDRYPDCVFRERVGRRVDCEGVWMDAVLNSWASPSDATGFRVAGSCWHRRVQGLQVREGGVELRWRT
jgi:hypothetical protein